MPSRLMAIVLLFIGLFSTVCLASNAAVRFGAMTIEDGLSQNTVFSIYQDRQGFMWFGTADGLNRFDGYRFKHFRHNQKDPSSLSNNLVSVLHEDINGNLWVGTEGGGLHRFNRQLQNFERFVHEPGNPNSLSNDIVTSISEDSQGRLWIGTSGGVNLYDVETQQFSHLRQQNDNPNSLSHDDVKTILSTRNGIIWIGTNGGGLNRYDPEKKQFTRYFYSPTNTRGITSNIINTLFEDSKNRLWVGTERGLNLLDRNTGLVSVYQHSPDAYFSISNNSIQTMIEDDQGTLWVGTYGGGLEQFIVSTGQFLHFRHQSSDADSLSNDIVLSTFQDATGLLWIGTWAGGVNKVDTALRRFGHFKHDSNSPSSLSHTDVSAIFVDSKKTLWVGTRGGGLNRQKLGELGFTHFRHDAGNPNSLSSNIVRNIAEDEQGTIWISTFSGGLNRFNTHDQTFTHFLHEPNNPNSISHNNVQVVLPQGDGSLWVGTWGGGLNRFWPKTGIFKQYRHQSDKPGTISDDDVEALFLDDENTLWIGTWGGGLNRFNRSSQSFSAYRYDRENLQSLGNDNILAIVQSSNSQLWVGTYGGGLNAFNRENGLFQRFTESDGLSNNSVYGILEDRFNNLWLSTNRGLSKFNPQSKSFRLYGADDGLQSYEFNLGAYFKSDDGEMFFGGVNGFNRFYPDDIQSDIHMPVVAFTDFLIFNQSVAIASKTDKADVYTLSQAIDGLKQIHLAHHQSLISIEFSGLDYRSPMKNQYVYKLEGHDDNWIQSDPRIRRATYTNLPAGSYTLRVKASNADKVWNHEGIAIDIHMAPPPWLSWWALCLYAFAVLVLVYLFVAAQRRKVVQERLVNQQLTRINKLKDEFLANTSHELRTPLNGIIGLTESLIDGATGPLPAQTNANLAMVAGSARRLSNLVNDILDFSKLQNRHLTLNIKPVDLHSMVDVVLALSRPLLGDKALTLLNRVGDQLPAVAADEDRLMQMLHNLIGNAIKFTDKGEITVSATVDGSTVNISVSDTGIGIAEDQLDSIFESFEQLEGHAQREYSGTGLGLAVTKQLVELHGGNINVQSTVGKGSCFTLSLAMTEQEAMPFVSPERQLHHLQDVATDNNHIAPVAIGGNQFSILIVDDEPINRQVLFNHLSMQSHYRLAEASSGQEALQQVEHHGPFDLILLDIMMPRMSGYEVCRKLRKKYPVSDLAVIFLTARNQVSDLVQSFAVGANDYLSKPVNKQELLSRVETHLRLLDINRTLERKVAQRSSELVHAEKMASLGTLTAGIAHEINNPTNFVLGSSQNLAADLEQCRRFIISLADERTDGAIISSIEQRFEPLYEHLETIHQGIERLTSIVNDLKTFTAHNADDKNLVDIRSCLQSTINLVQTQKHRVVQFNRNFKTVPEISCYPAQINQVIMNLLVNAVDAIEQRIDDGDKAPGLVEVGCSLVEHCIEITIKDNGCGMCEQTQSKLFEPFFTTKAVGKGTGLGLSIAYGIVQQHQGQLNVQSMLGKGSEVTLSLPL